MRSSEQRLRHLTYSFYEGVHTYFSENTNFDISYLPVFAGPTCEQCGPNERYSNCTNSGCFGALTCAEKGCTKKCNKIKPEDCKKGCICEKGYLRDRNDTCILEEKCPSKCTKPNEVFVECPGTCPARTCGINDCLLKCGKPLEVGDPKCPPPACICASGFFRNPKGDCVKRENCRKYLVKKL